MPLALAASPSVDARTPSPFGRVSVAPVPRPAAPADQSIHNSPEGTSLRILGVPCAYRCDWPRLLTTLRSAGCVLRSMRCMRVSGLTAFGPPTSRPARGACLTRISTMPSRRCSWLKFIAPSWGWRGSGNSKGLIRPMSPPWHRDATPWSRSSSWLNPINDAASPRD